MTDIEARPPPTEEVEEIRRLRRSRDDRIIAGVCGGMGAYFGVDPIWFRLAFVVLAIGGGAGVLVYLISWLIIPEQKEGEALAAREGGSRTDGAVVAGAILVAAGLLFFFNTLFPWFDRVVWPLAVIAVGAGLIYAERRRDR